VSSPPRTSFPEVNVTGTLTPMRLPPHDQEAEQAVLGSLLIDSDAINIVRDELSIRIWSEYDQPLRLPFDWKKSIHLVPSVATGL